MTNSNQGPALPGVPGAPEPRRDRTGLLIGVGIVAVLAILAGAAIAVFAVGTHADHATASASQVVATDAPVAADAGAEASAGAATSSATAAPVTGASSSTTKTPKTGIYRAAAGDVEGHPTTVIELRLRKGKLVQVGGTHITQVCKGKSTDSTVFESHGGTSHAIESDFLTYGDASDGGSVAVVFHPSTRMGTLHLSLDGACDSPLLRFEAEPVGAGGS